MYLVVLAIVLVCLVLGEFKRKSQKEIDKQLEEDYWEFIDEARRRKK